VKEGMLWFDNNPHTALMEKVLRAAEYYKTKYDHVPNLCFVHPSMLKGHSNQVEGLPGNISIQSNRFVLPGHLWIGVQETK
jgi:hypothetical protein